MNAHFRARLLIAPYDLSASLGQAGKVDHPVVKEAIEQVARVCKKNRVPLGIFGMTAESVRPFLEQGFTLIVAGIDTALLGNAARALHEKLIS